MKHQQYIWASILTLTLLLLSGNTLHAAVVFFDDMSSDSVNKYTELVWSTDLSDKDYQIIYEFDYSGTLEGNIPEAPNTPGSATEKTGMFMEVNRFSDLVDNDTNEANETVLCVFPDTGDIFGDYSFQFDLFANAVTPSEDGTDPTGPSQHIIQGIYQSDIKLPIISNASYPEEFEDSVGYYGTMDIAFDSAFDGYDVVFFEGFTGSAPQFIDAVQRQSADDIPVGFAWGHSSIEATQSRLAAENYGYITNLFPSQGGFNPNGNEGGCNGAWITLRMSYELGVVTWEVDNNYSADGTGFSLICTYDDPNNTYQSGPPVIAVTDTYTESENNENFFLIDNVMIESKDSNILLFY